MSECNLLMIFKDLGGRCRIAPPSQSVPNMSLEMCNAKELEREGSFLTRLCVPSLGQWSPNFQL